MPKRKKIKSAKQRERISPTTATAGPRLMAVAEVKPSQERETKEVNKELSSEKKNLDDFARDVVVSYDARVKVVGEIVEDTHKMMNDFRGKREDMSKELREHLAKSESLRRKDFDRMMADIVLKQNEREEQVKKMLADFRREEETVAEKLRNLLQKGEGVRIGDFKKMMAEIKSEQDKRVKETSASVANELQNMRAEVYQMLDNFKKERQSVATAWHEILGLFHQEKIKAKPADNFNEERAKSESDFRQSEPLEKPH